MVILKEVNRKGLVMKGSVLESSEQYYTYYECYPQGESSDGFIEEYCWISGDELTEIVIIEDFQWIGGFFSGLKNLFEKKILEFSLPKLMVALGFGKTQLQYSIHSLI